MEKLLILGSGNAGWTAALYAARANLNPLVITGEQEGGQLTTTTLVENYPGFPDGVQGPELMEIFKKQALKFGARVKTALATSFKNKSGSFAIGLDDGATIEAKSVIIATGASPKKLGVPGEQEYMGRGVSTCATCDGYFFRGKTVAVIGGGDSAAEESTFLAKVVGKVCLLVRKDVLRASKIMQERVMKNSNIEIMWNTEVAEVIGDGKKVRGLRIKDSKTNDERELAVDGMFLAIGHIPNVSIFQEWIKLNELGYVETDRRMHTNLPGVFASGDVQDHLYRQAVTAAGTGCMAAIEAERYLEHLDR